MSMIIYEVLIDKNVGIKCERNTGVRELSEKAGERRRAGYKLLERFETEYDAREYFVKMQSKCKREYIPKAGVMKFDILNLDRVEINDEGDMVDWYTAEEYIKPMEERT